MDFTMLLPENKNINYIELINSQERLVYMVMWHLNFLVMK